MHHWDIFLADLGIEHIAPKQGTLKGIIKGFGADLLFSLREELAPVTDLFLACDKGNKKKDNFFVKYFSWWDSKTGTVKKKLLDCDAAEGSSDDASTAIDALMVKLDAEGENTRKMISGCCTDNGGGGTGDSFAVALQKEN